MSRVNVFVMVMAAVLVLAGCEQFFSTNVFSGLQRDPSNLSFDQQVAYAESALNSGDKDAQADAYDALAKSLEDENNTDPELNELAAELAIGASGLSDTVPDLAEAALDGNFSSQADLENALDDKLDDVDYGYVDEAESQLEKIKENGGEVGEEQYVFVAAGKLMNKADEEGGVGNLDSGNTGDEQQFVEDAITDLESRDESSDLLNDLKSMYDDLPNP